MRTATTRTATYTITGKEIRTFTREDGTVLGTAMKMPGDRQWAVLHQDFRGKGFMLYHDTAELAAYDLEKLAGRE